MFAVKNLESRLTGASVVIDGKPVHFRFLTHEDKQLWMEFVDACSDRSLWLRFLSPFHATPERAEQFCNIDPARELAVVAEISEGGRQKVVGIARIVRCLAPDELEYAVIVADPWQKKALGRILTERCIELAKNLEIRILNAETVLNNFAMTRILFRCRFKLRNKDENMVNLALMFQ